jgi:WD40 repeat protein
VRKLNLYAKLEGHEGCVNAVEFNSTGDVIVSGSDDRQVMFWNWESKTKLFDYPSGHDDNIFQTKIMPLTDDSRIVTSAGDGQVNHLCMLASYVLLTLSLLSFCIKYQQLKIRFFGMHGG